MLPDLTLIDAESLLAAYRSNGIIVATPESCTGGLIAASLTAIAGCSDVVDRGFVTYSNEAKHEMIGVPMALIETYGAASEDVARAMAEGALPGPAPRSRYRSPVSPVLAAAARTSLSGWSVSVWPARTSRFTLNGASFPVIAAKSERPPWRTRSR